MGYEAIDLKAKRVAMTFEAADVVAARKLMKAKGMTRSKGYTIELAGTWAALAAIRPRVEAARLGREVAKP